MTERLKDKVCIVTGGALGIGRAYALGMAEEGAKIIIADINVKAAETTAKDIQATGREALAIKTDISSPDDTQEMARRTVERFGRIDVLVNNAAVFERPTMSRVPFWELKLDEWDRVINVNLKGPLLCCRAVFPYMKDQGAGKIINVSSNKIFNASSNNIHYVASKTGVIGLTRALAAELGDYNINVNCIAPGGTLSAEPGDKAYERQAKRSSGGGESRKCLKRGELPEDLVGTAIFLASSDSDFITGQTIVVDGGDVVH